MSLVSTKSFLATPLVLCGFMSTINGAGWNYNWDDTTYGPFYWQDSYATCSGNEQTPINIDDKALNGFNSWSDELSGSNILSSGGNTFLDVWKWSNDEYIYHFEAVNNGHSIALTPIDSEGNYLTSSSDSIARFPNLFGEQNTAEEFCLHSFHYHWGEFNTMGSEHTFYGVSYPAEIHFVHYSCKYDTLGDAIDAAGNLPDQRVLAVVGFLFEVDDDATDAETAVFTELYQRIYDLEAKDDTAILPNINLLNNILPSYIQDKLDATESNFWHYKGGLTTPPCSELVQWHVMEWRPKITNLQLTTLRSINGSHGKMTHNWRPIQNNINDLYIFEFESTANNGQGNTDGNGTGNGDANNNNGNGTGNVDANNNNGNGSQNEQESSDDSNENNNINNKLDDIEEKQEDVWDAVLAILVVLIVFCVMWVAYSANEQGRFKANGGYRRDSVSQQSRGNGGHETAAFVKK